MGSFRTRHRRKGHARTKPGQGHSQTAGTGTPNAAHSNKNTAKQRTRWLYDVRQYAVLTDATGHLLLLQLPKTYAEDAANAWTLPGGKLEAADEPGAGVLREIAEETGLTPTLLGPCGVARWSNRNSKKLGIFWRAELPGDQPPLKLSGEHQRAVWINPADVTDFPFHRPEMVTIIRQALKLA
jgi:8-oxo-dGTP diphosphatase